MRTPSIYQTVSFETFESYPKIELGNSEVIVLMTSYDKELTIDKWNRYLDYLSPTLIEEVNKYFRWQDKQNRLFGKLLVFLGYYYFQGIKLNYLTFILDKKGKPYVLNSDLFFNISHSDKMVVCAFSKNRMGIDIETIKNIDFRNFNNVFTEKEMQEIKRFGLDKFYEFWTKKEAVVKAVGIGITDSLLEVEVIEDSVDFNNESFSIQKYKVFDKFCSIAMNKEIIKVKWIKIKF